MKNVVDVFQRFFAAWRGALEEKPSEMHVAIMRAHRVQTWFQYHRGMAMTRQRCETCVKDRMFTIWGDGKYYCLACLYAQAKLKSETPVPMSTRESAMWDFSKAWMAYKNRVEAFEAPWTPPSGSKLIKLARIGRIAPPPICVVGSCDVCAGYRPFMRREDGDAGCIYCLMHGRIIEIEIVHDETVAA